MTPFQFEARTPILFGAGAVSQVGEQALGLGFRRTLVVSDLPDVSAVMRSLAQAGIEAFHFSGFKPNPDSAMVERGREFAVPLEVDSIVGLGGGSAMDCAKAINFVLTNGGRIQDYWGYGKASRPLLPGIGIPTTTGTGSEAQSYALIADASTKVKMACGDPKAAFRLAILDPALAATQPRGVLATAGYDAVSHAVETWVTTRRNPVSEMYSRRAWELLADAFPRALAGGDIEVMGAMQLGAYFAGVAIENSMLGAAHACANPLTARYGTTHGVAIAVMLAHVVGWNNGAAGDRYAQLDPDLPARLRRLAEAAGLPGRLREIGAAEADLPVLAEEAARQWTGCFNPRPFDAGAARELYRCAW